MPQDSVSEINQALSAAFSALESLFDLPREVLEYRPAYEGAWTVAEHLEHVSLVNYFLLLTIGKGCRTALKRARIHTPPPEESDLSALSPIAVPGAFDWPPPGHMLPSGTVELSQVRDKLRAQHAQCLRHLGQMPNGEGRLYSIRMSVNNLGRLDMYQWIFFLAQHAKYHVVLCHERVEQYQPEET